MLTFGSHVEKTQTAVTSMCFNQQGDLLLAGYGNGHLTIWDVQKAIAAKVIPGEHAAPIVHTLFLGQDPQVTRQFKAVTGDSRGLVLLHTASVVPLLNRFSIKTQVIEKFLLLIYFRISYYLSSSLLNPSNSVYLMAKKLEQCCVLPPFNYMICMDLSLHLLKFIQQHLPMALAAWLEVLLEV